jgi:hypothetical protein
MEFIQTLAAVGVGGLLAFFSSWVLEGRREKRDERARQRASKEARLLVADELDTIGNHLDLLADHGKWPVADYIDAAGFLDAREWHAHKGQLAVILDDEGDWMLLASLHYSVRQLLARAREEAAGGQLTPEEREHIRTMEAQARTMKPVVLGTHVLEVTEGEMRLVSVG